VWCIPEIHHPLIEVCVFFQNFDKTNNPEFSKKLRGIINDLYDLSDYYKKDKKTKKD